MSPGLRAAVPSVPLHGLAGREPSCKDGSMVSADLRHCFFLAVMWQRSGRGTAGVMGQAGKGQTFPPATAQSSDFGRLTFQAHMTLSSVSEASELFMSC